MFYGLSGEFDAPAILAGFSPNVSGYQPGVAAIQVALVSLEILPPKLKSGKSSVDGLWGPVTQAAYQEVTGTDQVTLQSLAVLQQKVIAKVAKVAKDVPPVTPTYVADALTPASDYGTQSSKSRGGGIPKIAIVGGIVLAVGAATYFLMKKPAPSTKKAVANKRRL